LENPQPELDESIEFICVVALLPNRRSGN